MARTLSANVTAALTRSPLRTAHLLTFIVGATTYRYADGPFRFQTFDWLPYLVIEAGPRYSERLSLEPVTVKLKNVDLALANMVKTEQPDLQGAEVTLSRLFIEPNEAVMLFQGPIIAAEIDEQDVTLVLGGDMDPTAATVPRRKYLSVNSEDGRTLAEMTTDGEKELFDGFLTITRDLTETVEGNQPDAANDDRALGAALLD
jgi:hypothetical protein